MTGEPTDGRRQITATKPRKLGLEEEALYLVGEVSVLPVSGFAVLDFTLLQIQSLSIPGPRTGESKRSLLCVLSACVGGGGVRLGLAAAPTLPPMFQMPPSLTEHASNKLAKNFHLSLSNESAFG